MFTKEKSRLAHCQLHRKSAGKPQCKDGTESASVNLLMLAVLSSTISPNTASTKGGASTTCEVQLCLFPCVKWKGVTWSHIGHTVQTGILYCSNASNQFIFFIKIIYIECFVSSVPSNFIHIYLLVKEKRIKWCKKKHKAIN